jgi:peroxiredoxin
MCATSWSVLSHSLIALGVILTLSGCGDLANDLNPSSSDRRPDVTAGSIGYLPTQRAADFTISDSTGNSFTLSDHFSTSSDPADVIVLYFTMWCPVCLAHSDHMYNHIIPRFSNHSTVVYALVDYVSGSVSNTRMAELANGYAGSDFITLADVDQGLQGQFHAAMATVVVIDSSGTILLNEDYRDGSALNDILEQQLP